MLTKQEIEEKYSYYFTYDKPIPYIPQKYTKTGKSLTITPFTMKDYAHFTHCSDALHYDRDDETNPKILKMNYLTYIMWLGEQEFDEKDNRHNGMQKFFTILSEALGIDIMNIEPIVDDKGKYKTLLLNYKRGFKKVNDVNKDTFIVKSRVYSNESNVITLKELEQFTHTYNYIGDTEFKVGDFVRIVDNSDSKEFFELKPKDIENICQIIMYQNVADYDDEYVSRELRKDMEETMKLRNKNNGVVTLERQMMDVCKAYGYKYHEIFDLSIRRFYSLLSFSSDETIWKLMKQGELGGMVTFKEDIPHYLCKKDKKFNNLTSFDGFKSKLGDSVKS